MKTKTIVFDILNPDAYAVKFWLPIDPASRELFKPGATAYYKDRELTILAVSEDSMWLGEHPLWTLMTGEVLQ